MYNVCTCTRSTHVCISCMTQGGLHGNVVLSESSNNFVIQMYLENFLWNFDVICILGVDVNRTYLLYIFMYK